jgi:hypothetical protein
MILLLWFPKTTTAGLRVGVVSAAVSTAGTVLTTIHCFEDHLEPWKTSEKNI